MRWGVGQLLFHEPFMGLAQGPAKPWPLTLTPFPPFPPTPYQSGTEVLAVSGKGEGKNFFV